MATDGTEPIGSMGTTPRWRALEKPQPLFNYFKQLFAQVTNPRWTPSARRSSWRRRPRWDPRRTCSSPARRGPAVGPAGAVLRNVEIEKNPRLDGGPAAKGLRAITIPMLFRARDGGAGLRKALETCAGASRRRSPRATTSSSSRTAATTPTTPPSPAAGRLGGAPPPHPRGHPHRIGLVLESGEPREVAPLRPAHRLRRLGGEPYLAFETIHDHVKLAPSPARPTTRRRSS